MDIDPFYLYRAEYICIDHQTRQYKRLPDCFLLIGYEIRLETRTLIHHVLGNPKVLTFPHIAAGISNLFTDFTHPERHSCRWAVHIWWKALANVRLLNSCFTLKKMWFVLVTPWKQINVLLSDTFLQTNIFQTYLKNTFLVRAVHTHSPGGRKLEEGNNWEFQCQVDTRDRRDGWSGSSHAEGAA